MKNLQAIRTHSSPYHAEDFQQIERLRLEKIPGVKVCLISEAADETPTILITNTHTQLKNLPPALLSQTKLILHSNSGYDNFIQDYHLWREIPVIVGHRIRAQAVAEYSLACVFQGLSELPQHLQWHNERTWMRPLIKDQTILIYGYGHIGRIVAQTLSALGAKILVKDPFISDCPFPDGEISQARIVIACASLNSSSQGLFNQEFFSKAYPQLIFINGARGKLVKESALREFLLSHPQAQAFLDVFEKEPFTEEWHHFPQVWKTSHVAGVHAQLDEEIIKFEETTLNDFVSLNSAEFALKYHKELLQNKWRQGELI